MRSEKIRFCEQPDNGRKDVVGQRLDDRLERGADDDADGQVGDVAPQREILEFL